MDTKCYSNDKVYDSYDKCCSSASCRHGLVDMYHSLSCTICVKVNVTLYRSEINTNSAD